MSQLGQINFHRLPGADPGFCNGGGAIFLAKGVTYTSKASYERREYKSAGGPGALYTRIFLNLEPLRVNLSVI